MESGGARDAAASPRACASCRAAASAGRTATCVRDVAYIIAYFVVGCLALEELEDMGPADAVYLLAATVTTVGYGDVTPTTYAGRWFVTFMMPLGIFLVSSAFVRSSSVVKDAIRGVVLRVSALCGVTHVDVFALPIDEASPADVARVLKYWFRYLVAAAPVLALFLCFVCIDKLLQRLTWGEAAYFATATCTTVGYGDRNFADEAPAAKYGLSLFLVVFVCVFADGVGECLLIRQRQRLRTGAIALPTADDLEALLLAEAREGDAADDDEPAVSEAAFVIWTLQTGNLVDAQILLAIRRAFHWDAASHRTITPRDVHAAHARRRPRAAAAPSYDDWRRDTWLPKLAAARATGRAARARPGRRQSKLEIFRERQRRSAAAAVFPAVDESDDDDADVGIP